jgi:hypothetical protein
MHSSVWYGLQSRQATDGYLPFLFCVYVMGDTAQSRMHASRPAYDPHCLQRHILEHRVPNTNAMQPVG